MATIAKIKTASGFKYKAIIKKAGKPIKSKTFTRKGDARTWASRIEADIEMMDALGYAGAGLTLLELSPEYLAQWHNKDKSNQIQRVNYWVDSLGKHKLVDLTARIIKAQLKKLDDKAPATSNRYKAVLASMLHYAVVEGYILLNPVASIPDKPLNNKVERFLSDTERSALMDACKESTWGLMHLLVMMAVTTGMRKSELVNLRWSDIDFEGCTAFVRTSKNGEPRILPLTNSVMTELARFDKDNGLLFASLIKPEKPFCFTKLWYRALRDSNIEDFRFHDLRHTTASYLAQNGASLLEIADVLGHKQIEVTKRYAHLCTKHKEQLINRVFNSISL